MKNKLWAFGDSFTEGHGCVNKSPTTLEYRNFLNKKDGDNILIYSELVANEFGLELVNTAMGGNSNETILDMMYKNIANISKDDYVILGISFFNRYDFVINKKINTIVLNNMQNTDTFNQMLLENNLSKNTIEQILVNRYNVIFKERLIIKLNAIKLLLLNYCKNVCMWTVDDILLEGNNDIFFLPNGFKQFNQFLPYHDINFETNCLIKDHHFGENGHKIFGDGIIKYFKSIEV